MSSFVNVFFIFTIKFKRHVESATDELIITRKKDFSYNHVETEFTLDCCILSHHTNPGLTFSQLLEHLEGLEGLSILTKITSINSATHHEISYNVYHTVLSHYFRN